MPTTSEQEKPSLNEEQSSASVKKPVECVASEEYSVLPETFYSLPIDSVVTEVGSIFHQRKYDIFERLQKSIKECSKRFSGRKELASESDDSVAELCESLEEALQYGLRPQQQPQLNFVVSAANLFQNMQEIVTRSSNRTSNTLSASTESSFWDFCQNFLTPHEKERFENLKQVWTKWGKGRAFIRASLNEHSLQRYLLTWLSEYQILMSYYTHWSVLLDEKMVKSLPDLIKSLDHVLFALSVDKTELNVAVKTTSVQQCVVKEEPLIYAPTPVKVEPKIKRKTPAVERPIASTSSTDDLLKQLQANTKTECSTITSEQVCDAIEELASFDDTPPDPIEPELEFLKEPLQYSPAPVTSNDCARTNGSISSANSYHDLDGDTSSQSSKYSNNAGSQNACNNIQHLQLEEQLKDTNERCSLLETRVAQLSLENRQLIRRLKKHFEDSGIDPSSSFATNFLITIPHTKLHKSKPATGSFHLYEIHITMRQNLEHWSIWRRYSDFNKLHKSLLKTHPSVSSVEFPPKKRFGNMNLKFVEERRQQLQIYLLNLVETLPQVEACKSKAELQKVFPFLRER
ncbi:sorting nexin-29 [Calliphora vicina]|uniref:sorting nexin-29 n=1 Tax=Calliphora vicina TaxID=7373 RepID=UPI00325A5D5D